MADRPALEPLRTYVVADGSLAGVVVEVDATEHEAALAVLQAPLHEPPEGMRLVFGYDVTTAGLGAWVGDRKLRILVWPAFLDADGEVTASGPDEPDADVLVIDLDPVGHADSLDGLARTGRLFIAGPEMGPTPLVVDVDRDLVADTLAELRST